MVLKDLNHSLYNKFFTKATGFHPFPFQTKMALDRTGFHELVKIPTGAGKTAGVVLSWIWKRRFASDNVKEATPRRLVYCLPRRVLVEQTYEKTIQWLDNLGLLSGTTEWEMKDGKKKSLVSYDPQPQAEGLLEGWSLENGVQGSPISVHLLMGGDIDVRSIDLFSRGPIEASYGDFYELIGFVSPRLFTVVPLKHVQREVRVVYALDVSMAIQPWPH